jgi:hypothetical protein
MSSRRVPVAQVTADNATGKSGHMDARVYLVTVGGGWNRRARRISFQKWSTDDTEDTRKEM